MYLQEKTRDAERILNSSSTLVKEVDLVYLRDLDGGKIRDTLKTSFQDNCKGDCDSLRPSLDRLLASLDAVKKGDRIKYIFLPETLGIQLNDLPVQVIQGGKEFNRAMLSCWLGSNPSDPELKKALLDCGKDPSCN